MVAPEIREIELQEYIACDEIPDDDIDALLSEWDENTHLNDYPGEVDQDYHYTEEYCQLRSIGLTHLQAEGVMRQ